MERAWAGGGDVWWLDSAIGDHDRGSRSLLVLETRTVARIPPGAPCLGGTVAPGGVRSAAAESMLEDLRTRWRDAVARGGLGWVGWLSYESAPLFDAAFKVHGPDPDAPLALCIEEIVAAIVEVDGERTLTALDGDTAERWHALVTRLAFPDPFAAFDPADVWVGVDRARYHSDVSEVLEAIGRGEYYQACYTFPLRCPRPPSFAQVYAVLRERNPGDFGACLRVGGFELASVSPERFVRVSDGVVTARPMKGTRRRTGDPDEDAAVADALLGSEKDRAENVMIVDLLRNDLGRVCEIGSVHVPSLFELEAYATVFQLTSTIEGKLLPDITPVDLMAAIFPPGSMTGAPKIAATNHLCSLEPFPRGLYAGSLFWLGFDGRWEMNVVIRALQSWGREARWSVGGGVVADSTPEGEWDEAMAKAAALLGPTDR